ncbi:putative phage endonuclease [Escherichia coli]|nr:putative phage endonuclease [Escherichia coli]
MPPRTPKTCRVRGYRNTTTDPSGYCKSHKSEGWKQYKPGQSCHQRGYGSRGCPSCSPVLCGVEETGHSHRFLWVDAIPFWIIPMPFMQGLYKTFVMAVRLTGPPGGVACHGRERRGKRLVFAFLSATIIFSSY